MTVTTQSLTLEDNYMDVIQKACRGLDISLEELAHRSDIAIEQLQMILNGTVIPEAIEKIAFVLNLHGPSLVTMAQEGWAPQPAPILEGLMMCTTWYGDMTVNAYLAWDPMTRQAATFDTGSDTSEIIACASREKLQVTRLFITHTHADHLADLDRLRQTYPNASVYGSLIENPLGLLPLKGGDGLVLGKLTIRVLKTSGHTPGGLSYFIKGLARPIVIVGDSLFASSMGGAPLAFNEALDNNLHQILSLPQNTLICPGHGPLTTVSEERRHNPFFPSCK